jgi:hypothetical protein
LLGGEGRGWGASALDIVSSAQEASGKSKTLTLFAEAAQLFWTAAPLAGLVRHLEADDPYVFGKENHRLADHSAGSKTPGERPQAPFAATKLLG